MCLFNGLVHSNLEVGNLRCALRVVSIKNQWILPACSFENDSKIDLYVWLILWSPPTWRLYEALWRFSIENSTTESVAQIFVQTFVQNFDTTVRERGNLKFAEKMLYDAIRWSDNIRSDRGRYQRRKYESRRYDYRSDGGIALLRRMVSRFRRRAFLRFKIADLLWRFRNLWVCRVGHNTDLPVGSLPASVCWSSIASLQHCFTKVFTNCFIGSYKL